MRMLQFAEFRHFFALLKYWLNSRGCCNCCKNKALLWLVGWLLRLRECECSEKDGAVSAFVLPDSLLRGNYC